MRFITPQQPRLTLYAWQEGGEFFLSPHKEAVNGRRPIQRFDDRQELEQAVRNRNNRLVWLTDGE